MSKMSGASHLPANRGSDPPSNLITSKANKWLKLFRSVLNGTGPAEGEFLGVEGPKLVTEAIRSGLETEALLVSATGEREMERIFRAACESEFGISRDRVFRTSDSMFKSVAGTETPQGVAALFRQPVWGMADVVQANGGDPLLVVLAGIQDPGNVGTILRSAEAFGATGAVTTRGTADPWSPKALRASAGSALRLPLARGIATPILLAQLKMHRIKVIAASARAGANPAASADFGTAFRGPAALFIGNEGAGLAAEVERAADVTISIPTSEAVESLNAGVAASVLLYEAARQRRDT